MRWIAAVMLAGLVVAPAAAQEQGKTKPKIDRRPNLISIEEIDLIRHEVTSAYDIVQRLRPSYLRPRGTNSFGNAAGGASPTARVIVDGVPRGDTSMLRDLPAATVKEIRYLNAADASTQYGTNYGGGAIQVFTRTQ
ncbi:MAG: hypothetical protein AB7L66_01815 [Gemmatimonadales bacterium]